MNCVHDRETQLHLLDHAYTARMDDSFEDLLTLSEQNRVKNVNITIHIFYEEKLPKISRGKNVNPLTSMNCVQGRETQINLLDHAYTARMDDSFKDLLTLKEKKNRRAE